MAFLISLRIHFVLHPRPPYGLLRAKLGHRGVQIKCSKQLRCVDAGDLKLMEAGLQVETS